MDPLGIIIMVSLPKSKNSSHAFLQNSLYLFDGGLVQFFLYQHSVSAFNFLSMYVLHFEFFFVADTSKRG